MTIETPTFNFVPEEWYTPNTYDTNYKDPTENSGVYLIVKEHVNQNPLSINYEILYVGSAKNLSVRYARHEVMRLLRSVYGYVQFYFKEEENFREVEKRLIKLIQPRFNTQHKNG